MDHTEFKQYLSRLEGLNPAQKRKLSDVLRVKDEGEAVAETLEKRISGGGHCPHCKHVQFQRWGISNGMQRYRCKSCLKTFNAATGTPLARLRKKEKWLEYSKAMVDGLSVRKAARKIDNTTSFRWRHRFLHGLRDKKDKSNHFRREVKSFPREVKSLLREVKSFPREVKSLLREVKSSFTWDGGDALRDREIQSHR